MLELQCDVRLRCCHPAVLLNVNTLATTQHSLLAAAIFSGIKEDVGDDAPLQDGLAETGGNQALFAEVTCVAKELLNTRPEMVGYCRFEELAGIVPGTVVQARLRELKVEWMELLKNTLTL